MLRPCLYGGLKQSWRAAIATQERRHFWLRWYVSMHDYTAMLIDVVCGVGAQVEESGGPASEQGTQGAVPCDAEARQLHGTSGEHVP